MHNPLSFKKMKCDISWVKHGVKVCVSVCTFLCSNKSFVMDACGFATFF